jgi:hypothetical protein
VTKSNVCTILISSKHEYLLFPNIRRNAAHTASTNIPYRCSNRRIVDAKNSSQKPAFQNVHLKLDHPDSNVLSYTLPSRQDGARLSITAFIQQVTHQPPPIIHDSEHNHQLTPSLVNSAHLATFNQLITSIKLQVTMLKKYISLPRIFRI